MEGKVHKLMAWGPHHTIAKVVDFDGKIHIWIGHPGITVGKVVKIPDKYRRETALGLAYRTVELPKTLYTVYPAKAQVEVGDDRANL